MEKKTLIELLITLVIFIFGACVVEFCFSYFSGDGVSTNTNIRIVYAILYLCCVVWVVGARIVHAIKKDK